MINKIKAITKENAELYLPLSCVFFIVAIVFVIITPNKLDITNLPLFKMSGFIISTMLTVAFYHLHKTTENKDSLEQEEGVINEKPFP